MVIVRGDRDIPEGFWGESRTRRYVPLPLNGFPGPYIMLVRSQKESHLALPSHILIPDELTLRQWCSSIVYTTIFT